MRVSSEYRFSRPTLPFEDDRCTIVRRVQSRQRERVALYTALRFKKYIRLRSHERGPRAL